MILFCALQNTSVVADEYWELCVEGERGRRKEREKVLQGEGE